MLNIFLYVKQNRIGVDAKSENVPVSQNKVKGQLGSKKQDNTQTHISMSSPDHIISIKVTYTIQDILQIQLTIKR